MRWFINGTLVDLPFAKPMFADRGITFNSLRTTESNSDNSQINATITVNASVVINTTNFTCEVSVNFQVSRSYPAQLIVMGKY